MVLNDMIFALICQDWLPLELKWVRKVITCEAGRSRKAEYEGFVKQLPRAWLIQIPQGLQHGFLRSIANFYHFGLFFCLCIPLL